MGMGSMRSDCTGVTMTSIITGGQHSSLIPLCKPLKLVDPDSVDMAVCRVACRHRKCTAEVIGVN
jgi:hypothetical protein